MHLSTNPCQKNLKFFLIDAILRIEYLDDGTEKACSSYAVDGARIQLQCILQLVAGSKKKFGLVVAQILTCLLVLQYVNVPL